jgi:3'(2'), 5'-bisphosphate nucleotidase
MNEETKNYIQKLEQLKGNIELASRGSSLKICMVAEGSADIYPRFGPTMEWDTAAGHAIAIGAGCSFVQGDERSEFIYNKENLLNPYFIVSRK